MNVFGVCNDETQIKRYFFLKNFFSYFNGLNELACGRELHPVEGIFATRLLKRGFRRGKIEFRGKIGENYLFEGIYKLNGR